MGASSMASRGVTALLAFLVSNIVAVANSQKSAVAQNSPSTAWGSNACVAKLGAHNAHSLTPGSGIKIELSMCGAKLDGVTDDYSALTAAYQLLEQSGGGQLIVNGIAAVSSGHGPIFVPHNVTTSCMEKSGFILTGEAERPNWFTAENPRNVWFRGCSFTGNGVGETHDAAGALFFHGSIGGENAGPKENFGCISCQFRNFRETYWVYVLNDSRTPMTEIRFENTLARSERGNMLNADDIHYPSAIFGFRGQHKSLGGLVSNVVIKNSDVDCTWIKSHSIFWSGTSNFRVMHNKVLNCGVHTSPNSGGYAELAYNDDSGKIGATVPSQGVYADEQLESPFSCGIYLVHTNAIEIDNPYITGQRDRANETLPKAAICVNQGKNIIIRNPELIDNHMGIDISGDAHSTACIVSPKIRSSAEAALGIRIQPRTVTTSSTLTVVKDPWIELTGGRSTGVLIKSASGRNYDPGFVEIDGGRIAAKGIDVQTIDDTTTRGAVLSGLRLTGGLVLAGSPANAALVHDWTSTPTLIDQAVVDAREFSPEARIAVFTGNKRMDVRGLRVENARGAPNTSSVHLALNWPTTLCH
jgi:hypothetical protein